ncbi:hypothetical protein B0H13DRAFT_382523 [Mycena leptocephala]|nr:hypothetical protein B0H13DRAFT_382523 [Mycena leptocephala]
MHPLTFHSLRPTRPLPGLGSPCPRRAIHQRTISEHGRSLPLASFHAADVLCRVLLACLTNTARPRILIAPFMPCLLAPSPQLPPGQSQTECTQTRRCTQFSPIFRRLLCNPIATPVRSDVPPASAVHPALAHLGHVSLFDPQALRRRAMLS